MSNSKTRVSSPRSGRSLSLQAALRSLGQQLDQQCTRCVRVSFDPEGVEVQTTTERQVRRYSWADLETQAVVQRQLRADTPTEGEGSFTHTHRSWARWLRVVGAVLETQAVRTGPIQGTLE